MAKCSKSNLDSPPTPVLVDRISDLPNSILLHILSLLPFKSTATTSILSKRWTNLFQHFLIHTHSFDFGQDFAKAQTQQQFINTVNQYLQLHNGSKIHKFHLLFHPGIQNQVHADKWLEFALERSVKELGFDFCGPITESDDLDSERLTLLDSLYLSNSLTHLKLGQFEFNPPMAFTGFASLVSLYLRRVNITDGNLGSVLMKCPLLTDLSLCECGGLNSIKIFGPKEFLLERLFVGNCYEAYEIEVLAPNLKSFHFYGDLFYGYSFRDISALEDVYLNSNGFEHTEPDHNYIEILSSVSTVKILTVCTGPLLYMTTAEEYFPEDLPVNLPNLEELQIIVGFPLDEDQLSYFYGFFKHTICPCLDKLFIELCADHFELSWQSQLKEGEAEELAATSFDNLKTIKITNFRGTEIEMRLVKFFLSKSISLEQLVLVAAQDSDLEKQIAGTNDSSMTSITIVDEVLIQMNNMLGKDGCNVSVTQNDRANWTHTCVCLIDAYRLMNKSMVSILRPNFGSWRSMMVGYVKHQCYAKSLKLFKNMIRNDGTAQSACTLSGALGACSGLQVLKQVLPVLAWLQFIREFKFMPTS